MPLDSYYLGLINNSKEIIIQSLREHSDFTKCHAFCEDLNNWWAITENRYEQDLYSFAINEYQRSLYLALQGSYRQAYMALRFFIEHSCAAVYFSYREIDYRRWSKGNLDISWSTINSPDLGVFSKQTVGLYFNELKDDACQFQKTAQKIYRECSEFTHGNFVTYDRLSLELCYKKDVFLNFIELVKESMVLITFLFTSRFFKEIDFSSFPNIASSINDHIGFIKYFAYENSKG